jgi:hypothetical protein
MAVARSQARASSCTPAAVHSDVPERSAITTLILPSKAARSSSLTARALPRSIFAGSRTIFSRPSARPR